MGTLADRFKLEMRLSDDYVGAVWQRKKWQALILSERWVNQEVCTLIFLDHSYLTFDVFEQGDSL